MNSAAGDSRPASRQLALVHVAKERLGLAEEEYRDLLEAAAGVRSARELDHEGLSALMRRFIQLGFLPLPPAKRSVHRPGMATPARIDYIRSLWKRYAGAEEMRGLNRWLHRRFGISGPRSLNREMAHLTLIALKAMTARKEREPGKPPRERA